MGLAFYAPAAANLLGDEPAGSATEGDARKDKSHYHLFQATPASPLRDLNTDRPDQTESPYTVDAGHVQVEFDYANYTYDRYNSGHAHIHQDHWGIFPVNLKAGLFNHVDFQLVLETYKIERTADYDRGVTEKRSGFGDILPRLKVNLWGNDGGHTAFGALSYVKIPASQDGMGNNAVEGGLLFPLAVELPSGWDMTVMTGVEINQNAANKSYHSEFINSITFGHSLIGKLAGYAEFFSAVSTDTDADWVGMADFGLTYGITKNWQIDAGINIGITRVADDFVPFAGMAYRF